MAAMAEADTNPAASGPALAQAPADSSAITVTPVNGTVRSDFSSAASAPILDGGPSPYLLFRNAVRRELRTLAETLRSQRDHGTPADADQLRDAVESAMRSAGADKRSELGDAPTWEVDARRATLDRAWEELVHEAAASPLEGPGSEHLQDLLDAVLSAFETDYVDETFPLSLPSALMDLQPITACEPLLGYIESRAARLTKGMEYVRGRGPILLRLLNDLLRRLPRSQSEPVILSGRILLLLSSVYPLGEKSGVNLRGNFNLGKVTVWEQEMPAKETEKAGVEQDARQATEKEDGGGQAKDEDANMAEVEEGEEAEPSQDAGNSSSDFYPTFWSLQRYFNNPHLLFAPVAPPAASSLSSSSSSSSPFSELQTGIRKTLAAFAAATRKEKELSGAASKEDGGRASTTAQDSQANTAHAATEDGLATNADLEDYFFPKFLTRRNLLDLEIADPAFRRQILVQFLILFQYLLSLTPSARTRTETLPVTNQPALSSHVVSLEVETWVQELRSRTLDEMDAMEGGRRFRKAVMVVLTREQNWTDWKLRSCYPFTKPSLATSEVSMTARARQKALARKPKRYPYALGNPRLDRLWRRNTTSLEGFEPSGAGADDVSSLLAPTGAYSQSRIALKRAQAATAAGGPAVEGARAAAEAAYQAAQWRVVRAAATSQLRFFAQIGSGEVEVLRGLMDEERRAEGSGGEDADELAKAKEEDEEEEKAYDSDDSVLGLRPPRVREAGTPEPPPVVAVADGGGGSGSNGEDVEMNGADGTEHKKEEDEVAGTPPPRFAPEPAPAPAPVASASTPTTTTATTATTLPPPSPAAATTVAEPEPGTPPPPTPAPASSTREGVADSAPRPARAGTPKRPREDESDPAGDGATEASGPSTASVEGATGAQSARKEDEGEVSKRPRIE